MRSIILGEVSKYVENKESQDEQITVRCIGHSLGGALAMINAADLSQYAKLKWNGNVTVSCCTFGAPAAGNRAFAEYFNDNVIDSTRVVVQDDPITYLPCFPWFSVSLQISCVQLEHVTLL